MNNIFNPDSHFAHVYIGDNLIFSFWGATKEAFTGFLYYNQESWTTISVKKIELLIPKRFYSKKTFIN